MKRFNFLLLFLVITINVQYALAERLNVTDRIITLGNPYLERYPDKSERYARNIWDMIAFEGKLYLGAGNSSNIGPAPNAGPVPVICYSPGTDEFSTVFTLDDEQVNSFYDFTNRLYIPGHDATEGWGSGNFYTFTPAESWKKHRKIPAAIHVYALAMHNDRLFAALGTQSKVSIASSADKGESWVQYPTGISRIMDFLLVSEQLFAVGILYSRAFALHLQDNSRFSNTPVYEFTDDRAFSERSDLRLPETLFPNTRFDPIFRAKIIRSVQYKDKNLYIGAKPHNDHQSLPFGAYIAHSLIKGKVAIERVPLPGNSVPWDILVKDDSIFILAATKKTDSTEISVWHSTNAMRWDELFFFEASTFSRSFEYLKGSFYFGLGGEFTDIKKWKDEEISQDTGTILQVMAPLLN